MTEIVDLWGNPHNIDELGTLIEKQKEKALGAIRSGPTPINEIKSMNVNPDDTPEKWFNSHQKMVDFIARYTRDIDGMKIAFAEYIMDSNTILQKVIHTCRVQNDIIDAQRLDLQKTKIDLANFQEKYKQDMADLMMALDAASQEETNGEQQI
jgi:hypothetical protein